MRFRATRPADEATSPGAELAVQVGDLVRWGHPAPPRPQTLVLLRDGSRLVTAADWSGGAAVHVDDQTVTVRSDNWDELKLPRESVAGIVFAVRERWQDRQRLEEQLRTDRGAKDVVLLTNQDRVSGKLTKLAGGSLTIDLGGRETDLPLSRVAAVGLAQSPLAGGSARPRPQPPRAAIVGMRDGSLLVARRSESRGEKLALELTGGARLVGGLVEDVVFLQGSDGEKFVYVSDLEPADYQHVPYLSIEWPYRQDRSVTDSPLLVGGRIYLKGIGMHSAARLTYRLDGQYRRFDATAAIDDSAGDRGSVTFGVYLLRSGEWKQAAVSDVVRGGEPPEPVSVDVRGADALTLTVDFADRGDELDHADWLDARLTRN